MRKYIFAITCTVLFTIAFSGCGGLSRNSKLMNSDSVSINNIHLSDSAFFPLSTGGKCDIVANAQISYPETFSNPDASEKVKRLFAHNVLEAEDSIPFEHTLKNFAIYTLKEFGINGNDRPEDVEDDYEPIYKYVTSTIIDPVYNKNHILSFCKHEITMKNGKQTMSTHRYYNFDLDAMKEIEITDLFADSSIEQLSGLIKASLMAQLNAKTDDDVINLGYFNLDNLKANNNFRIGDTGITWTYLPYEIALLSVGETNITVGYDELEMYLLDNDLTNRIKQ